VVVHLPSPSFTHNLLQFSAPLVKRPSGFFYFVIFLTIFSRTRQGFLGQAAGQAIADVLFGDFNPGGRLTMSVPYDAGSLPAYYK
jgi:hypothetical protein